MCIRDSDPTYIGWALAHLTRHPAFAWTAQGPADWRARTSDWPGTRYESKALREGRQPVFLRFTRR